MQQTKEQQQEFNYKSPAFPPQVAQDNFGRIFAAIPGMSKLEYFALQLLPTCIQMQEKKGIVISGKSVTPYQAAVEMAKILIDKCNPNEPVQEPGNVITMDAK
jgi:hypothetical protein